MLRPAGHFLFWKVAGGTGHRGTSPLAVHNPSKLFPSVRSIPELLARWKIYGKISSWEVHG